MKSIGSTSSFSKQDSSDRSPSLTKSFTKEDKAFICRIMQMDTRDRPSAKQLLADEWVNHPEKSQMIAAAMLDIDEDRPWCESAALPRQAVKSASCEASNYVSIHLSVMADSSSMVSPFSLGSPSAPPFSYDNLPQYGPTQFLHLQFALLPWTASVSKVFPSAVSHRCLLGFSRNPRPPSAGGAARRGEYFYSCFEELDSQPDKSSGRLCSLPWICHALFFQE